jgi:predicted  nucleic acid-binding Zn-ribbon protein
MRKLPRGLAELPAWFARTPAGQQAMIEAETTAAQERRALAAPLPELEAELEAAKKRLTPVIAKARERLAVVEREYEAARQAVVRAEGELASTTSSLDSRMSEIRRSLRAGADTDLIARCRAEIMEIRNQVARHAGEAYLAANDWERKRQRGELALGASPPVRDADAFQQRIDLAQRAINRALDAVEALHWAPEFDVSRRFATIRDALEREVRAILPEMGSVSAGGSTTPPPAA